MYYDHELKAEMYGDQMPSHAWNQQPGGILPSPDRHRVNLGQPLEHLRDEPSPEAVAAMFAIVHGKGRKALARRLFGRRKSGPRAK